MADVSNVDAANTGFGALTTFAGVLPGVPGLIASLAGLGSGAYSTATSTDPMDAGVNAAGTWGGLAALPATIAGLAGVNTGVALGGLSTIAGAGGGLGAGAAATTAAGALAGGAAIGGAVLGAGAAGWGIGRFGDAESARLGAFGQNDQGQNRGASDWAADQGMAVRSWMGGDNPGLASDIAGGVATVGASVLAAPVAVGSAIVGGAGRAYNAVASW